MKQGRGKSRTETYAILSASICICLHLLQPVVNSQILVFIYKMIFCKEYLLCLLQFTTVFNSFSSTALAALPLGLLFLLLPALAYAIVVVAIVLRPSHHEVSSGMETAPIYHLKLRIVCYLVAAAASARVDSLSGRCFC